MKKHTRFEYPRSIAQAAYILDAILPKWYQLVTKPIRMGSVDCCILGQVFLEDFGRCLGYDHAIAEYFEDSTLPRNYMVDEIFGSNGDPETWMEQIQIRYSCNRFKSIPMNPTRSEPSNEFDPKVNRYKVSYSRVTRKKQPRVWRYGLDKMEVGDTKLIDYMGAQSYVHVYASQTKKKFMTRHLLDSRGNRVLRIWRLQ